MREPLVERISANAVVQSAAEVGREIEHIALLAGIVRSAICRKIMALPFSAAQRSNSVYVTTVTHCHKLAV